LPRPSVQAPPKSAHRQVVARTSARTVGRRRAKAVLAAITAIARRLSDEEMMWRRCTGFRRTRSATMIRRAVSSAVRASGLHPEGPQFESEIAHHSAKGGCTVRQNLRQSANCGDVVQLVRTLPCHGRGREFESRRPRHFFLSLTSWPRKKPGSVWVQYHVGVRRPAAHSIETVLRLNGHSSMDYCTSVDLLTGNKPPGRMASTSLPCARRLLSAVA
jgi:hypothetical protein